jgi:hypothetical protein
MCKKKRDLYRPAPDKVASAIHHVVYEYANLVSTGTLLKGWLAPPINTHVQDAFLLSCRKLADFFRYASRDKPDVLASHYVPECNFELPVWQKYHSVANVHVAHISYTRLELRQSWDGSLSGPLLEEMQQAWRLLLDSLAAKSPSLRNEFDREISLCLHKVGFENLNLR